jgi:ankyrin repeat protein
MSIEETKPITLPNDILKLIIGCYPCRQWFTVSKEISSLASQVISPLQENNKGFHCLLCWAILCRKTAAKTLLRSGLFDPLHCNALQTTCQNGNKEVLEVLLQDPGVNPSSNSNSAIRIASTYGKKEIVEILLKDHRVDPSALHNQAIREASTLGHKEVVKLLLQDPRVNPSDQDNAAIQGAVRRNHNEVVELLLQDPRVDPSADNNRAIRDASTLHHKEIVEILRKDPRVDPSADKTHYAIRTVFILRKTLLRFFHRKKTTIHA